MSRQAQEAGLAAAQRARCRRRLGAAAAAAVLAAHAALLCGCRREDPAVVSFADFVGAAVASVARVTRDAPGWPGAHGRIARALCFSGGGARSQVATIGALRALHRLGLMRRVDAISSVSGGTWAAGIYMFADVPAEELLGPPTAPAELSLAKLRAPPSRLGATATVKHGAILRRLRGEGVPDRELFQAMVAEAFLKPFGLQERRYMAGSREQLKRILARNPTLSGQDFHLPVAGRPPVLVMGGSMLSPVGYTINTEGVRQALTGNYQHSLSLQMSPDFTGSPFRPESSPLDFESAPPFGSNRRVEVGGGLVETFAFGGSAPFSGQDGSCGDECEVLLPERRLTLADAMGISSAAYGVVVAAEAALRGIFEDLVPRVVYWPVLDSPTPPPDVTTEPLSWYASDGGNLDNSGVPAMLQRRANKVVWWNHNYAIADAVDYCNATLPDDVLLTTVDIFVGDKFGFMPNLLGMHNQVFQKEDLRPLMCDLQRLVKAGRPAVVRRPELQVVANDWWGVEPYVVDLTMVYLDRVLDFERALPQEVQEVIEEEVPGFPNYNTVFVNDVALGTVASLSGPQVNLLAAQGEYVVYESEDLLREVLDG